MSSIDVNDLQSRIDLLYHITDDFVERAPVAPVSVEQEETIDEDGNTIIKVSFGGGEMNSEEELQAKALISDIISRLANLKDNLKTKMDKKGQNKQLVEQKISSSPHLSTIIGLNNSEKHGYPLKRHKRTDYDPRIENIRKELVTPLISGRFTNILSDSIVTFEADVVDKSGEQVYDFRDLVENSLCVWEDFCTANLPNDSGVIIARRDKLKRKDEWQREHFSRGKEVERIISNPKNWHEISGHQVIVGMIVRATGTQLNAATLMGFPSDAPEILVAKDTVKMFDVVFGNQVTLGKESNKWELLVVDKQSDLKLVNDYYWELFHPPDFS